MKKLLLVGVLLLSSVSAFAGSGLEEMRELISVQKSIYVSDEAKALGFDIQRTNKPVIKSEYKALKKFLKDNEQEQQLLFNQVVDSGEMDYLGDDRDQIKKDAKKHLDVKYLFEIGTVYKVTKDGKFVGYIFDISEHGQAAIYQDGAWSEVYLDKDFNIVFRDQKSA